MRPSRSQVSALLTVLRFGLAWAVVFGVVPLAFVETNVWMAIVNGGIFGVLVGIAETALLGGALRRRLRDLRFPTVLLIRTHRVGSFLDRE